MTRSVFDSVNALDQSAKVAWSAAWNAEQKLGWVEALIRFGLITTTAGGLMGRIILISWNVT